MSKTVEEYVEAIPENMRGHVFHALGKSLGGVHTADAGSGNSDGDSGDNYPKPTGPGSGGSGGGH